ncbi:hypothetical protein G9403_01660 [Weissella paramesenteroides]|uniref:Uncharacterized protein n=1 Tax=Weissella paramesenteroides TaxID=1249 RepID=A0ABD4XI39_WEIPA|nr:hypothetical protein [Weissella paramesenteroides]MDF8368445.1 hypothetical protein [Weissella paramesenteroides]MDF8370366.1 hypothetical protein [Weissella paramesenteroides]
MKKKLGIIQVLAILIIGIMIGAFAERSHVFGYADNTPIIPNGTYKTTNTENWEKITVNGTKMSNKAGSAIVVDNRFTTKNRGRLVITSSHAGNRSRSYYIAKIKEGWRISPIINGKPDHKSNFIIYAN